MRKMGFKVYQKYFNRMLPIRSISFDKYGNIEDITVDNRGMNGKYNVIPVFSTYRKESDFDLEALEILQSTGITDKNGRKIFEGDIVQWTDSDGNNRIDFVKWVHGGLVLCNAQYTVGSYLNNDLLVIGNIFENPEILK